MAGKEIPAPPQGAGPSGRTLWADILGRYELESHEAALLVEVVRTVDQLDQLYAIVEREGLVVSGHGTSKAHPALTAAQQLRITLARVVATLRLPTGDPDELGAPRRPQRRQARGIHLMGGT
jgi:sugar lactone lactonase YvrE